MTENEKGKGVIIYPPNMAHQSCDVMSQNSKNGKTFSIKKRKLKRHQSKEPEFEIE